MLYVLSDVHGNRSAWDQMLKLINFGPKDELYVLGDVIDRNPYGIDILREIMDTPNIHMLLGNHEYMMAQALNWMPADYKGATNDELIEQWYHNGGKVTHDAFKALSKDEQDRIRNFVTNLPLEFDLTVNGQRFKLCHAAPEDLYNVFTQLYYTDQCKTSFCVWERELIELLADNKEYKVIFGHTPTCNLQEYKPMVMYHHGAIYDIDCGCAYVGQNLGGRLCCVRLDDFKEYYTDGTEKNDDVYPVKLPRPWIKDLKPEKQRWTYEYSLMDLESILERNDHENISERIPTLIMTLKTGILDYFKEHPDILVGSRKFPNETPEEISRWMGKQLEAQTYDLDMARQFYKDLVLATNMGFSE